MDKATIIAAIKEELSAKVTDMQKMIADISGSIAEETKSSAGDKYETARSMAQMEADQIRVQLSETQRQIALLQSINQNATTVIRSGSIVQLDEDLFFIGVPAGTVSTVFGKVFCISAAAPVSLQLLGKKSGDAIPLAGKQRKIIAVN